MQEIWHRTIFWSIQGLQEKQVTSWPNNPHLENVRIWCSAEQAVEVRAAPGTGNHTDVGQLLDASWQIKRSLVDGITGEALDDLYSAVMELGTLVGNCLVLVGDFFVPRFSRN